MSKLCVRPPLLSSECPAARAFLGGSRASSGSLPELASAEPTTSDYGRSWPEVSLSLTRESGSGGSDSESGKIQLRLFVFASITFIHLGLITLRSSLLEVAVKTYSELARQSTMHRAPFLAAFKHQSSSIELGCIQSSGSLQGPFKAHLTEPLAVAAICNTGGSSGHWQHEVGAQASQWPG